MGDQIQDVRSQMWEHQLEIALFLLTDGSYLKTSNEFEYLPVHATRFRTHFHHPTRYDQTTFDTIDRAPCPDLHFQASPICLMIQAQPHLCSSARLRTDRVDAAQLDVNRLLELYRRHPIAGCNNHPASVIQPFSSSLPPTSAPTSFGLIVI